MKLIRKKSVFKKFYILRLPWKIYDIFLLHCFKLVFECGWLNTCQNVYRVTNCNQKLHAIRTLVTRTRPCYRFFRSFHPNRFYLWVPVPKYKNILFYVFIKRHVNTKLSLDLTVGNFRASVTQGQWESHEVCLWCHFLYTNRSDNKFHKQFFEVDELASVSVFTVDCTQKCWAQLHLLLQTSIYFCPFQTDSSHSCDPKATMSTWLDYRFDQFWCYIFIHL